MNFLIPLEGQEQQLRASIATSINPNQWCEAKLGGQRLHLLLDPERGMIKFRHHDSELERVYRINELREVSISSSRQWLISFAGSGTAVEQLPCEMKIAIDAPGQADRMAKMAKTETRLKAPMTGRILQVNVNEADVVNEGDQLMVIEAMKMENKIFAPIGGTIKNLRAKPGEVISAQDDLCAIAPAT